MSSKGYMISHPCGLDGEECHPALRLAPEDIAQKLALVQWGCTTDTDVALSHNLLHICLQLVQDSCVVGKHQDLGAGVCIHRAC